MTILIGYVPAPEGDAALTVGFEEAKIRGVEAIVVNSPRTQDQTGGAIIDAAASDDIVARAQALGVKATVIHPAHEDDLVGELNRLVEEHQADRIVIGLRKRSPIGKFILGSQAQRIMLEASVPVLTARG